MAHAMTDQPQHTNRLAQETSPYLLQHQHNPVDWYAWGAEAFEASRAQNKPATWHRLNAQAFQWLQSQINRSHEQQTNVSSEATVCGDGAPQHVIGRTPEDLANRISPDVGASPSAGRTGRRLSRA